MKTIILLFILGLSINFVGAEICTGNYIYDNDGKTTGADYISKLSDLSMCTQIDGSLTISNCATLNSLSPLSLIKEITQDLTITGNIILRKIDIASVTKISGTLSISNNSLNDYSLSNLTYVGSLQLLSDSRVANLGCNLKNLANVNGDFFFKNHKKVSDILSFSSLTNIAGTLYIESNEFLEQISGFNGLLSVGGFQLKNHDKLKSVTGFSKLLSISSSFEIYSNSLLASIYGFSALTSADSLNVESNLVLSSLYLPKLSSLPTGIILNENPYLVNLTIDLTGSVSTINLINVNLSNVDVFCKVTSISSLLVKGNANLQNLNGFYGSTTIDIIEIYSNPALTSLEGLSRVQSNIDTSIYNNVAKCGTFYTVANEINPGFSRFDCCGDGIVQSDNGETCDGTASCSSTCKSCNSSSSSSDCNCNPNLCMAKPFGVCLSSGSCLFSETYINTALCGNKLTGITYATVGPTNPTSTSVIPTTVDDKTCFVNGSSLYCRSITSPTFSLIGYMEVANSLSITGSTIKINLNTHVVLQGSLVLRNSPKLSISTNPWLSHKTVTIFEYTNLDGDFASVSFNDTNACLKYTLTKDTKAMYLKVWNQCVDDENVNKSVTSLFVIIIVLAVAGGGLWWFVKNRKQQERRAGGLGK